MMKLRNILLPAVLSLLGTAAFAQTGRAGIEIDYNAPKDYIVAGVDVEGSLEDTRLRQIELAPISSDAFNVLQLNSQYSSFFSMITTCCRRNRVMSSRSR